MTLHARLYRLLTGLYPRSFRHEYASDLAQAFADLARQHGMASAWKRACVDLAVSVPYYHLEALMHRPASSSAFTAMALALGAVGFAGLMLGAAVGLPLLVVAAVVALLQRSELARSLNTAPDQRRTRLRIAATSAVVFVVAVASWLYHIDRYDALGATSVIMHNLIGLLSLGGTIAFGLAALLTRKRPARS